MTGMAKKKRKNKSIYMEVINNESQAALKWFPRDIMPISQAFYMESIQMIARSYCLNWE